MRVVKKARRLYCVFPDNSWYPFLGLHGDKIKIKRGSGMNLIDKSGKFISPYWFEIVFEPDTDGSLEMWIVEEKNSSGLWNALDKDGNLISERWMDKNKKENKIYYLVGERIYEINNMEHSRGYSWLNYKEKKQTS